MVDIILHVGLPKTGTTTVQESMCMAPEYLGKYHKRTLLLKNAQLLNIEESEIFKDYMRSKIGVFRALSINEEKRFEELKRKAALRAKNIGLKAVFYSDEDLALRAPVVNGGAHFVSWPYARNVAGLDGRVDKLPIVKALRRPEVLWPYGSVKVILTVRRQWEWIQSCYYERSDRNLNASQWDFEEQVRRILEQPDYLNFAKWYRLLTESLGKENVLILPLEGINHPRYWDQLCVWAGIYSVDPPKSVRNVGRRSSTSGAYDLKSVPFKGCIYEAGKACFKGDSLNALLVLKSMVKRGAVQRLMWRSMRIEMTRDLEERLRKVFCESNHRLDEVLEIDLQELGYYC